MVQATRFCVRDSTKTIQVPRAPLHAWGITPCAVIFTYHVSRLYPAFIARTDSCARPTCSSRLRFSFVRLVFAGCRHSLLQVAPSRRYLCESFSGCLDPYPGGSSGAFTRFFPENIGLYQPGSGSALNNTRTATSVRKGFRGCSHSLMFRPPDLLATPVAPTTAILCSLGSRGFYFPAYLSSLPPRAGDMLAV